MSDGASAKFEGWNELGNRLEATIRALEDRSAIEAVIVEATAPLLAEIRQRIGPVEPWRERGFTEEHIVAAPVHESSHDARVELGAVPGPNVTLRMLEGGTSNSPAQAPLRRSYDARIGEVRGSILAGLRRIAGALLR